MPSLPTQLADSPPGRVLPRLRRNRMACVGAGVIAVMATAGLGAPLMSAWVLGLSPDEQHTSCSFAPPGTQDVSVDHPSYDGDPATFPLVDLDGDGRIACQIAPLATLVLAPDAAPRLLTRVLGPALAWPAAAGADAATARVPLREVMAAFAGDLRCPELDNLADGERFYAFLLDRFDLATGADPVRPGLPAPDQRINLREIPSRPAQIADPRTARAAQALGLLGTAGHAQADRDGDGLLDRAELTHATRRMRFDPQHLLAHHDRNRDLAIDRTEYPGLPRLRTFWLGADQKGRDLLARLLHGARLSLGVGLLATLVALGIGVSYGAIAGQAGGRVDGLMMRTVDVLYGLPFMFIVILLLVLVGRSTVHLFIALGAVSWLGMARLVRGQVQAIRRREYVEAAIAAGLGRTRILLHHVLPNALGPVVVYATLGVPAVILEEAFLSFLGLGVQAPDASWGTLIAEGSRMMADRPWLILWPALAMAVTLFALNFVGEGLRDALDPRETRASPSDSDHVKSV